MNPIADCSDGVSGHVDVVHLKVSQGTAIEEFDQQIAARLIETAEHEDLKSPVQVKSALTNDGTNACAFISVKIADILLGECPAVSEFLSYPLRSRYFPFREGKGCTQLCIILGATILSRFS